MATKPTDHVAGLILAGGLSGVASYLGIYVGGWGAIWTWFSFGPGLIFGIIISLYYHHFLKLKSSKIIPFIVGSTASYCVAYNATVGISHDMDNITPLSLLVGGAIGTFLLLLTFSYTITRIKLPSFIGLLILGSILSLSYYVSPEYLKLIIFFFIWQAVMAGAIRWATKN